MEGNIKNLDEVIIDFLKCRRTFETPVYQHGVGLARALSFGPTNYERCLVTPLHIEVPARNSFLRFV